MDGEVEAVLRFGRTVRRDQQSRRVPLPERFNPGSYSARLVEAVRVEKRRGRPLPVHADGDPIGVTPAQFDVAPAALRVIVGPPETTGICAWEVVGAVDGARRSGDASD